ncbi:unnamed protein product [Ixodes pacificus]
MKVCCINMLARAAHLHFATKHVGAEKSGRRHWWAFIKILKDSTPSFAQSGHDSNGHQCLQHAPCCQYQGMHQVSANLFFILVTCKTADIVVEIILQLYFGGYYFFLSRQAVCAILLPWKMLLV